MDVTCWILTGQSGAGKTTFCQTLIQQARDTGADVAGILSPSRFENGSRSGIDALDIRTGERRQLASRQRTSLSDLAFGHWFFNPSTLDWGNQVLVNSVPCEILVIDELGPLEFKHSIGWTKAFQVLLDRSYHLALVVIRPDLVDRAREMLSPARILLVSTPDEARSLAVQVVADYQNNIRPVNKGG